MISQNFPDLPAQGYTLTSEPTSDYNCIAWAAGVTDEWWWPDPDSVWPVGAPRNVDIASFVSAFALLGYTVCPDGDFELGYEKVALFADAAGEPTHAARQLGPGAWTSKLGEHDDLTHTLAGLERGTYGAVVTFLMRAVNTSGIAVQTE